MSAPSPMSVTLSPRTYQNILVLSPEQVGVGECQALFSNTDCGNIISEYLNWLRYIRAISLLTIVPSAYSFSPFSIHLKKDIILTKYGIMECWEQLFKWNRTGVLACLVPNTQNLLPPPTRVEWNIIHCYLGH
jgi:hypothetical protein